MKKSDYSSTIRAKKISPYVYPGVDIYPGDVNIANFLATVAAHYNLSIPELIGRKRVRELVEIRQCMWHVLYEREKKSYAHIGRFFDRDHATVLYGVKKVQDLLSLRDRQMIAQRKDIVNLYQNVRRYGKTQCD